MSLVKFRGFFYYLLDNFNNILYYKLDQTSQAGKFMELSIYETKTNFSKIVQLILDGKEDTIIVSKNGTPVVQITPISKKNSKRVGIAKKEMSGFDISLEEFNAIPIEDFGI